jgi:hypothetical protein
MALPSDMTVLDAARSALSDARDWLNSDTADAISCHRSAETGRAIDRAMEQIGVAKAAIDAAKDAALRQRGNH